MADCWLVVGSEGLEEGGEGQVGGRGEEGVVVFEEIADCCRLDVLVIRYQGMRC